MRFHYKRFEREAVVELRRVIGRLDAMLMSGVVKDIARRTGASTRLGVGVLALGYSALADIDVRKVARARMQPLVNEFKGIVGLVARDGFNIQHLETCHSATSVISLRIDADAAARVVDTAFGQALLWALPQDEGASPLCQLQEQSEEQWRGIRQSLSHAFACIERDGFCVAYGR